MPPSSPRWGIRRWRRRQDQGPLLRRQRARSATPPPRPCPPSQNPRARSHLPIEVDQPEPHIEPVLPLVVVHGGPVEKAPDVDAARKGIVHGSQTFTQVPAPHGIIVGTDAELRDQERRSRQLLME